MSASRGEEHATTVVNVKVAHIRPQYKNLREWMAEENNVYIGRAGIVFVPTQEEEFSGSGKRRWPPAASKWANPYKVGDSRSREEALELYERHLDTLLLDESNRKEFQLLRGKTLGCWCKPAKCHGDIITRRLAEMNR